jgi:alpha-N-arabinofuranosidase
MRLLSTTVPRKRILLYQRLLFLSFCFPPTAVLSQAPAITATVEVAKTGAPISKNIYGQFLEHGGDIVNTGIWSEMLVDRKFFYPVATVGPTPPPAIGNAAGNPRFQNIPHRWWAPVGGDSVVTMDTKAPYTGDQSPAVRLSRTEPHGIWQAGLVVRAKKTYTGRIILAGTPGTVVRVALIWGSGATSRQAITIHALSPRYRTYPLRYTADADSDNATLEITDAGG